MKLADLMPRELVGFGGADRWLYEPVQNVPVKSCRSRFALWFDMFGHESIREFGYGGYAAFGGLLVGRIVAVRHRSQDDLSPRSGLLRCDFSDRGDGVAPHRRTATCAGPVDDHVGHCACGSHTNAKAGHSVIPNGELASVGLQGVHRALGNSLTGHLARSLLFVWGNTGAAPNWNSPEFPDSSVEAKRPKTIEFLSLRESLGMSGK